MRIGLAGAHRVGKTTLAHVLARIYDLPLLTSVASSVAADHGFNMATDNRLDTGMAMQAEQLAVMASQLRDNPVFISDRTPIDAAAYLLADATAPAGTVASREETVCYIENAMRLTARHFDVVILIPPAITFEPMDGKPPMNAAYQEHHHQLVRGMLYDDELVGPKVAQIARTNTERANRVAAACDFLNLNLTSARDRFRGKLLAA